MRGPKLDRVLPTYAPDNGPPFSDVASSSDPPGRDRSRPQGAARRAPPICRLKRPCTTYPSRTPYTTLFFDGDGSTSGACRISVKQRRGGRKAYAGSELLRFRLRQSYCGRGDRSVRNSVTAVSCLRLIRSPMLVEKGVRTAVRISTERLFDTGNSRDASVTQ